MSTSSRIASAVVSLGLLFAVLPAQAQYAFNYVSSAKASGRAMAAEAPKATTYKLVHGVVQDANGALAGATAGLHVRVSAPQGYEPDPHMVDEAARIPFEQD